MLIGQTKTKHFEYFETQSKETLDSFAKIEQRIEKDAFMKRKVCAKYLGSENPWLPVKPQLNVHYYYLDTNKKLGWCVNAKVSSFLNS